MGLSVRELLGRTYEKLEKEFEHSEITFPKPAFAEIANDSDWHRTRKGYIKYEKANLFKFNGNEWALSIGRACGDYPADSYDTDLSAIKADTEGKLEDQVKEEMRKGFSRSIHFSNSLVYGKTDGSLVVGKKSPFKNKILEILRPQIENYIAKMPEYSDKLMTMDLKPVVMGGAKYKTEFVDFLAETIAKVLCEPKKE